MVILRVPLSAALAKVMCILFGNNGSDLLLLFSFLSS